MTSEPVSVSLPLVSIGIPTYNRASLLRLALAAILRHEYANIEVIVSDNASSDETWAICNDAKARDARVRIHRQPSNIGPIANFEFVKNEASGKYFMWLADDDILSDNYIRVCVGVLENDVEAVLAYGGASYVHADGTESSEPPLSFDQTSPIARVLTYLRHVGGNAMFCGMYRSAALLTCRLPNILGADWAWIADVCLHGKAVCDARVSIRKRTGGASASYARIMEILGTPRWLRRYPFLTLALGISRYVGLQSESFRARYPFRRFVIAPLVGAVILYRMIVKPFLWRMSQPLLRLTRRREAPSR